MQTGQISSTAADVMSVCAERDGSATWKRSGRETRLTAAHWPLSRIDMQALPSLTKVFRLEHLDMSGEYFPTQSLCANQMDVLAREPILASLAVHGVHCDAATLIAHFEQMRSLRSLDLRGVDIIDEDVQTLVSVAPQLNTLALGGAPANEKRHHFDTTRLSARAWDALTGLRSLRRLSLRDIALDDEVLNASPAFVLRLQELDVGDTYVGDDGLSRLEASVAMRRITADGTRLGDRAATAIARIPTLVDCCISRTRVGDTGVRALARCGQLQIFRVAHTHISDDSLAELRFSDRLEELDVSYTQAGFKTLSAITSLASLRELILDHTPVPESEIGSVSLPSLESLSLRGIRLAAETVEALSRWPALRNVTLEIGDDWTALESHAAVIDLIAAPPRVLRVPERLRKLHLTGPLTEELCRALSKDCGLEEIRIAGGGGYVGTLPEVALDHLRTFFGEGAGLTDDGVLALSTAPNLEELYISGNRIGGSIGLLRAPYLNTLELRNTDIDDSVIEALVMLPRLHCLDVPHTNITGAGLAVLVSGMPNLQSLAVDGSQITDISARAIANVGNLVELYLYGDNVTNETIACLSCLVRLREINLFGTSITDAVIEHIAAMRGIRTVRLSQAAVSNAAWDRLRAGRSDIRIYGAAADAGNIASATTSKLRSSRS